MKPTILKSQFCSKKIHQLLDENQEYSRKMGWSDHYLTQLLVQSTLRDLKKKKAKEKKTRTNRTTI